MGSERVKGCATKTIGSGVAHPRRASPLCVIFSNFSIKVVARILRRILVTLWENAEALSIYVGLSGIVRNLIQKSTV